MTVRWAECWLRRACVAVIVLAAGGCEYPRDANGTLDRIRTERVVRVGYTSRPPWVIAGNSEPGGIEPRLVQAWADRLGARVEWVRGSESSLVDAFRAGRVDLVIGGHLRTTPWSSRVATTQPFTDTKLVVAVPPQHARLERVEDLRGRVVQHPDARPDLAGLIASAGALPQADAAPSGGLAVFYDFQAAEQGLTSTTFVLAVERHVMLVAQGESALLFDLDRFLLHPEHRAMTQGMPSP